MNKHNTNHAIESVLRREAAELNAEPVPASLHDGIMKAVRAQHAPVPVHVLYPWRLVAAAIFLIAAVAAMLMLRTDRHDVARQTALGCEELGALSVTLDLPDEQVAWLSGSWMEVPMAREVAGLKDELLAWAEPFWDVLPAVTDVSEQL